MKLMMLLVNAIYWLEVFIIPSGIIGFIALWLYIDKAIGMFLSILLGAIGIVAGILLAEYIRKHYGLVSFFSRLSSTPDIDDKKK
jgi:uncharacterized membrane protein YeaQ/YmgE (transglycosylase-associated protein family)